VIGGSPENDMGRRKFSPHPPHPCPLSILLETGTVKMESPDKLHNLRRLTMILKVITQFKREVE